MFLMTSSGIVELADYHGTSPSAVEFSQWFVTTFPSEWGFDPCNRDAMLDDFRSNLAASSRYSGIAHTGYLPEFFDDGFYTEAMKIAIRDAQDPLYFTWQ